MSQRQISKRISAANPNSPFTKPKPDDPQGTKYTFSKGIASSKWKVKYTI